MNICITLNDKEILWVLELNLTTGLELNHIRDYFKGGILWRFDTELDAFNAYKVEKEIYVKELAQKYQNDIDERSYVALLNYKVDIND